MRSVTRMMLRDYKGFRGTYFGFRILDFGISTPHSAFRIPQSGMTLIEVILVMVIIAILAAVVIPKAGFDTSPRASLEGAANMIASDIRYAQEFAMANRVSKSIQFSTAAPANKYTFSPVSTGMDPSGQLSGATIGTTIQFTFNSLGEPTTSSPGVWAVTVSAGGVTRTITVLQYTGKVNIS